MPDFAHAWKWCYVTTCGNTGLSLRNHCSDCGVELVIAPCCECGEALAPKRILVILKGGGKSFCEECGQEWSEAFVGSKLTGEFLMAQAPELKGLLNGD